MSIDKGSVEKAHQTLSKVQSSELEKAADPISIDD